MMRVGTMATVRVTQDRFQGAILNFRNPDITNCPASNAEQHHSEVLCEQQLQGAGLASCNLETMTFHTLWVMPLSTHAF